MYVCTNNLLIIHVIWQEKKKRNILKIEAAVTVKNKTCRKSGNKSERRRVISISTFRRGGNRNKQHFHQICIFNAVHEIQIPYSSGNSTSLRLAALRSQTPEETKYE